jgi:glycosyltransferase involved in cell wall biosynthesis
MSELPALEVILRERALGNGGARPTVGPARWDGYSLFNETGAASWHFGDLPARELARRGVFIDVLHLDWAIDRERLLIPPSRLLVYYSIGARLDPAALRQYGGSIILAIDDDLRNPTPWLPVLTNPAEFVKALEPKLRAANGIVCPTPRIAEWLEEYGVPVTLIPLTLPRLDELPRPRPRHERAGLRIGWVGTFTHEGDLECIARPVLALLGQHPKVKFVLAGKCHPRWTVGHPQIECHFGACYLPGYYAWLASLDLDVFVCPLASGQAWNEAKPALKPLEAAGLGIPVIASRVGAYAEDLVHEESALVVENTLEAWSAALTRMVEDEELRAHLAAGGYAWASRNTIEATADTWAELWGHTTHERKED